MRVGYFLASEEYTPTELVEQAKRAEQAGFHALWISDHFHPWNDEQGHSGFVWSVIGALAQATSLPVTTGVTCPTVRIHPAIIAQAAATSSILHGGRFNLGVGSGEALNEHILGDRWPEADVRLEMLEEAVEVIRTLWRGGQIEVAARIGDGFCTTAPDADAVGRYRDAGGTGPVHAGTKVCFMADEDQARRTVHRIWPNEALPGELAQVLPTPSHFEQACELVTPEMIASPVGPDLDKHVESLQAYADAGVDELFVQQIGSEHDAFFGEWAREVLPRLAQAS
jgi:alkanesulfonate monooxygenase SsuD/methylene tetrahydromethanopterin reductase-like flavin-dependent oxidoreductase (luciferase family)